LLNADKPSLPPTNVPIIKASEPISIPSQHHEVYWLSSKAHAIFHPKEDEMVLDAIKKQIEIQHDALSSHLLITSIIEGDEEDLTTHQIISVREQCQILSLALSIAVDNMPVWKNWNKCCEVAICIASKMGVATSRNARVVRNWYQNFRMKRKFVMKTKPKYDLPPLLERNQELCIKIKEYVREHLSELSSEMLCEYMHNVVMPILVKDETWMEKENVGYTDFLKATLGNEDIFE
jgi:hypothetical protein